jgi:site-specific DNA-cytosine methylase
VRKVILDLCGGTGSWSMPYVAAGYDVRVIDLPSDVRLMEKPKERVHGILAAPPCTYFSRMRMCQGRPTAEQFREGLSVVDACIRLIMVCRPQWWVLENPQGYLQKWLGRPAMKFHPWEFGDPWTKRTWLWGSFTPPMCLSTIPTNRLVGNRRGYKAIAQSFAERARTPQGFANAFFAANP